MSNSVERLSKKELVLRLADQTGTDEATATRWLNAVTETIYQTIASGKSVTIANFGNFYVRPERETWVFKFSPSQRMRSALRWSSTYKGE